MKTQPGQRTRMWAWIGGIVLIAGIIAIVVAVIANRPAEQTPLPGPDATSTADTSPPATTDAPSAEGDVVDASVAERGWVPEPITTDPDVYIPAALAAASTFDTQLSSRDEWLTYLDSWFTPDTRYTTETDRDDAYVGAKRELRQGVVLPRTEWESLEREAGRVFADASEVTYADVPHDESGDMRIGTADVTLTFTRTDGAGVEHSYDEFVRVSVQVLCGPGSVPAPGSAQAAGDCKVVRFFTEPMEP